MDKNLVVEIQPTYNQGEYRVAFRHIEYRNGEFSHETQRTCYLADYQVWSLHYRLIVLGYTIDPLYMLGPTINMYNPPHKA